MGKIALMPIARTASSRLPNKMLFDLGGKPAFMHIIERITSVINPDYVVVACTKEARDDPIELFAKQYGIDCFRGGENPFLRAMAAGHSLGLKDDDIVLWARSDEPLSVHKYLPYAIEQMDKYDCEFCLADFPVGTLVWGFNPSCDIIHSFGLLAKMAQGMDMVEGLPIKGNPLYYGCQKVIRLKFPPEYLILWPWGRLTLDWQTQAVVLKEIYRRLYKGSPIDVFDVYDLMKQRPWLANLIPLEFLDHPKDGDMLTCIRSTREMHYEEYELVGMDVIEVTWGGE